MPKRYASIGAIMVGLIVADQSARIYDGLDVAIRLFHVPMLVSWAVAALAVLLYVMQFREANV